MAEALKLTMANERFQLAVMNDTEPSARDVAAFERDLNDRKVRVLFYNKQAPTTLVQHLIERARASKIRSSASPKPRQMACRTRIGC
jgi:zinc/manganese transport system substrate-binding protein